MRVISVHARLGCPDRMQFIAVPLAGPLTCDELCRRDLEFLVWTYPRNLFELMELMETLDHGL